jgi:hypothetical protein
MFHILQAHHPVGQQFERPALSPIGSLATRQMNQLGFSLAIQAPPFGTFSWKASREGYFHILLDKPLFNANNRAATDRDGLGNPAIGVIGFALTLITHQQHPRHQVVLGWIWAAAARHD